ncbi:MAG: FAD-dependent oxidoreductase [Planctomycetota bacterium]|jgi:NADPH-dependent glutamate synthase beta subunit-like oxidoreductase
MSRIEDGRVFIDGAADMPLNAGSLATTDFNLTGSWKVVEPFYQDLKAPCGSQCLAGGDTVKWLALASEGKYDEALGTLREANPFPAICGRVCPHPCESLCNRLDHGGAVAVHFVERFLGDYGIKNKVPVKSRAKRGEKVAVVGSGPAGLSCAFYLGRQGFDVTVFEGRDTIGGLLRTGIPEFRLPRDVLDAELEIFRDLPVKFETGKRLGKHVTKADLDRFDAVFLAVGLQASRKPRIDGEDLPEVLQGIDFLLAKETGNAPPVKGKVIVVGGGNTALDCARTVMRLGAEPIIAYRRTEEEMPAFPEEVAEARREGLEIQFMVIPLAVHGKDGHVSGIRLQKTRLGEPDESGRRRPVPIEGSEYDAPADWVIMALGEMVDKGPIEGLVPPPDKYYIGGDLKGAGTVGAAISQGRHVAADIEKRLAGSTGIATHLAEARGVSTDPVPPERINPTYIRPGDRKEGPERSPSERNKDFKEVHGGMTEEQARREAMRCLACGTCVRCDNCMIYCPDRAIVRDGDGYKFLYDYCKGCGICVEECPRGASHIRKVKT